ncbi:cobyric acid synthase [Sulfolobus acidocaldarius SUSAZ]|nr:cobyric acid synthase [Sulfolobus acidocaldarius SUSAZ]
MAVIIASTMSDSGKSTIVAGLSKLFHVKPFKAQNMSLNSYATLDYGEIAFIQAYQSIGAGFSPERYMNPLLLKPSGNGLLEVIFFGESKGIFRPQDYYSRLNYFWTEIEKNFSNEFIVESAGGIEPNFLDKDLALKVSANFNVPIILVLDIDRGGAFTSALGSYLSLPVSLREKLRGFIINKFRGEEKFLEPGIKWLEERTDMKYLGSLPYFEEPLIMPEDSMNLNEVGSGEMEVSVIAYPQMSNFNEFYALNNSNAHLKFVKKPTQITDSDLVILPGSKNTIKSLEWLKSRGFTEFLKRKPVLGICGGFQIMGSKMIDSSGGLELGDVDQVDGLGLFEINTVYEKEKVVSLSSAQLGIEGYEIRRGRIEFINEEPLTYITRRGKMAVNVPDGVLKGDKLGLSIHGSMFSPGGKKILNEVFGLKIYAEDLETEIKKQVDNLSRVLKQHVDVDKIYELYI